MEWLKKFVGGIFGTAIGLFVTVLSLLSLPLNMLVAIRWYGFEWWSALILVLFLSCIPVIGQIGFIVGTLLGAYYLFQADFDWRIATESRAVATPAATFNVAELSPVDFSKYKTKVLKPGLEAACMEQAKARGFEGKVQVGAAQWCACFSGVFFDNLSQREYAENYTKDKAPSEIANRVSRAIDAQCGKTP